MGQGLQRDRVQLRMVTSISDGMDQQCGWKLFYVLCFSPFALLLEQEYLNS